jgi:hypothetical protein
VGGDQLLARGRLPLITWRRQRAFARCACDVLWEWTCGWLVLTHKTTTDNGGDDDDNDHGDDDDNDHDDNDNDDTIRMGAQGSLGGCKSVGKQVEREAELL